MAKTTLGINSGAGAGPVQTEFSLPDDCYVVRFNFSTDDRQAVDPSRMIIWYAGTPASDTDFNNADLGSLFVDETNGDCYIHTAAATWTKASP